jgi:hypothetical protein
MTNNACGATQIELLKMCACPAAQIANARQVRIPTASTKAKPKYYQVTEFGYRMHPEIWLSDQP